MAMALLSLSTSSIVLSSSKLQTSSSSSPSTLQLSYLNTRISRSSNCYSHSVIRSTKCNVSDTTSSGSTASPDSDNSQLRIGSAIIVVEAPTVIKTAASIPCLRVNHGLVKPGDVGRIVARKPKDVWAVRLTIGTYLIDGKYFKPLVIDE